MTAEATVSRGRVIEGTGGLWRVRLESGDAVECSIRGRLKQEGGATLKLAVGDNVELEQEQRGSSLVIRQILPRTSQLARRAPGGAVGERVLVANLDQVVVVFAAASPEPHPRMLDRFLVIAEANDLTATIVINKVDLTSEQSARERFELYRDIGYNVIYTSVKQDIGLAELRDAIAGRCSALSGPSGVGKSSLLNSLYPGHDLRVGEISPSVQKGRHTTVGARLIALPDEGFVADTPGLRELGVWGIGARDIDRCFPEIRACIDYCRFKDCAHIAEPQCAVREALDSGKVPVVRYDSYLKLRSELDDMTPRY